MAKYAPEDRIADFFQELDTITEEADYNPNYVVPADIPSYMTEVRTLCQGLFEFEKNFYYCATQMFYANVKGLSVSGKVEFWKSVLKGKYATATRYMRAIHKWKLSGVDYPYSIPVVYLQWSQSLLRSDKADFVEFLAKRRTVKEIQDWIAVRNNGGKEPERYGWAYLKKYLPDDALTALVDRAKRYGVSSLLDWKDPAEDYFEAENADDI